MNRKPFCVLIRCVDLDRFARFFLKARMKLNQEFKKIEEKMTSNLLVI